MWKLQGGDRILPAGALADEALVVGMWNAALRFRGLRKHNKSGVYEKM